MAAHNHHCQSARNLEKMCSFKNNAFMAWFYVAHINFWGTPKCFQDINKIKACPAYCSKAAVKGSNPLWYCTIVEDIQESANGADTGEQNHVPELKEAVSISNFLKGDIVCSVWFFNFSNSVFLKMCILFKYMPVPIGIFFVRGGVCYENYTELVL